METYNVLFNDSSVNFHIPYKYYETFSTKGYFKRLKKVASKGYIVSYEINDNEIIYYETNRLKGYKRYRIDKKQNSITEVQIYIIEETLKNAPLCTFANKIKPKKAIFVNKLSEYYPREFKIPFSIGSSVVPAIAALSIPIDPTTFLLALSAAGTINLAYVVCGICGSIIETNKEVANLIFDMPIDKYLESKDSPELVESNTKSKKAKDVFREEIKELLVEINDILSKLDSYEQEKYQKILEDKYNEYKSKITSIDDLDISFQLNSDYFIVFLTELRRIMLKSLDFQNYITNLDNIIINNKDTKRTRTNPKENK